MSDKKDKLRRLQKLLAKGFDLSSGPIAPFLIDSVKRSGIIDSVAGGLATLEEGDVIPVDEIENPDGINLEGSLYLDGRVYSMEHRREANRELLDKIKSKSNEIPPME